jgi:hypothetical protein
MEAARTLHAMIETLPLRLGKVSEEAAARRVNADSWSAKQELGHLLDSAIMNHVRFLRVLSETNPTLWAYDGEFCAKAHAYHERDWAQLIATWTRLNAHFLMAADEVSAESWKRPCVFDGKPATLEFMFTDYVEHALHHLEHIGIDIVDLKTRSAARV